MPEVIFVVGIPCSGKSTWAQEKAKSFWGKVLSRDDIRLELFGKKYKQNNKDEQKVTEIFDARFKFLIHNKKNFIIDNTNIKFRYIFKYIMDAEDEGYKVSFKYFPIGLIKACYRNILRYLKTGKFIPFKVIKRMYYEYKKMIPHESNVKNYLR